MLTVPELIHGGLEFEPGQSAPERVFLPHTQWRAFLEGLWAAFCPAPRVCRQCNPVC